MNPLDSVLSELKKGNFVLVLDEHREKEGDFFVLAEHITPEKVNFLLTYGKGMICVACEEEIIKRLQLPLMTDQNSNAHGTNFCMSVDGRDGITTGVSAADRARAIQLLADPKSTSNDFVTPGHTFPLLAQDPKNRFGHTEAAVLLAQTAQCHPVVVICEVLNEKGNIAHEQELLKIAEKWKIPFTTLEEIQKES